MRPVMLAAILAIAGLGLAVVPPLRAQTRDPQTPDPRVDEHRRWMDGWPSGYDHGLAERYWREHRGRGFYGYPFYGEGYPYGSYLAPLSSYPYAYLPYAYPTPYTNEDLASSTPAQPTLGTVPGMPNGPSKEATAKQTKPTEADELLTVSGVPLEGTAIRWPIGLRVLAPTESNGLRQEVETFFQRIAQDKAKGKKVDPHVVKDLRHDLDRLQALILQDENQRWSQSWDTYQQAQRFVAKLRHALDRLQQL